MFCLVRATPWMWNSWISSVLQGEIWKFTSILPQILQKVPQIEEGWFFFFIFERFALWLPKTFYDIILNSKTAILSKIFFQSWIFEFSIFEIFELGIFWNWIWSYLSIHETQQLQQVVPRPLSTFSMYYLYLKCPLGSYLSNAPRIMSIRHVQMKRRQIKKKLPSWVTF